MVRETYPYFIFLMLFPLQWTPFQIIRIIPLHIILFCSSASSNKQTNFHIFSGATIINLKKYFTIFTYYLFQLSSIQFLLFFLPYRVNWKLKILYPHRWERERERSREWKSWRKKNSIAKKSLIRYRIERII